MISSSSTNMTRKYFSLSRTRILSRRQSLDRAGRWVERTNRHICSTYFINFSFYHPSAITVEPYPKGRALHKKNRLGSQMDRYEIRMSDFLIGFVTTTCNMAIKLSAHFSTLHYESKSFPNDPKIHNNFIYGPRPPCKREELQISWFGLSSRLATWPPSVPPPLHQGMELLLRDGCAHNFFNTPAHHKVLLQFATLTMDCSN